MGQYFGTSQNGIEDKQSGTEGVLNLRMFQNYCDILLYYSSLQLFDLSQIWFGQVVAASCVNYGLRTYVSWNFIAGNALAYKK